MHKHCIVSASFHARKSKIELQKSTKTWNILKATMLCYIFQMKIRLIFLKYAVISNISKQGTRYVAFRGVHLISYSSQNEVGHPPFLLRLFDSFMINIILTNFEKIYRANIFQGNDFKNVQFFQGRSQTQNLRGGGGNFLGEQNFRS